MDTLSYPVTDHDISDGWQDHLDRGSLGGIDLPVPYGTPVYADHDGYWSYDGSPDGSGGRVGTIEGGGITSQVLHLSSGTPDRNVSRGELVAYSGASAYGSNYGTGGPHVHWHAIVGGRRVNPLDYLGSDSGSSSSAAGKPTTPEGEDDMAKLVLVEIPLDPNTGAQIGDGNPATNQKHVFCVNPENHSFWHVVNNDQLKAYRAIGIPFYESQGNGWILEFRLLKNGESA